MTGIVKEFPGVRALGGVDLDVRAGEVHCLLGQNGAGKSTLIKVLSGFHQPDEGTIAWDGEEASFSTPAKAIEHGVATIYQELDLVPHLDVTENVFLGHEVSRAGFSQRGQARKQVRELLARLGHSEISPTRIVGELSPAAQQIVSMARALSRDTRLLVLDEPSAVLDQEEVNNLFRVIRGLTAEGVAVVYISHRLEEIREIGDRITVLKDGRTVATGLAVADTPTSELIKLMTGRSIEYVFPPRPETAPRPRRRRSSRCGTWRWPACSPESTSPCTPARSSAWPAWSAPAAPRSSRPCTAPARPSAGTVTVDGKKTAPRLGHRRGRAPGWGSRPRSARARACCSTRRSTATSRSRRCRGFARLGFLDRGEERRRAAELTASLDVRPDGVTRAVRTLSGGNQQKVVLARWLLRDCRVLLLDEPTRGVDVGARSEIYQLIRSLADRGVAVVVVSSEIEEVLGLADRVLVVREGVVVHESAATEIDEATVLDLVMEGKVPA